MELFEKIVVDFFTNPLIITPVVAWGIAQILKMLIHSLVERKFDINRLFGDGGMPSGHSATVCSLVVMCAWCAGFDSAVFAVSIIVAIIVMHDARGVRRETGKQAQSIKELAGLINGIFLDPDKKVRTERLKEFVGHTPLQVFFGAILGILVGALSVVICEIPYASFIL